MALKDHAGCCGANHAGMLLAVYCLLQILRASKLVLGLMGLVESHKGGTDKTNLMISRAQC